jgi:hypothetical protein
MKLEDKAADRPDVKLARDSAPGAYELLTDELVSADELTDEDEFPQFGDFLRVGRPGADGAETHIECPAALARWLVGEGIEIGDVFRIRSVQKLDNEWSYQCEPVDDGLLEDAVGAKATADDD